jgi:hypothetical protein
MSLLGSLLCLPHHFDEITVLQPNEKELTVMKCSDVKVMNVANGIWKVHEYFYVTVFKGVACSRYRLKLL